MGLQAIIERLKRGEHVSGADKAVYAIEGRNRRRVSNVLKHFNVRQRQARERLVEHLGSEEKLRIAMVDKSKDPHVVGFMRREKRERIMVIEKLEDMID